uniref:Uncharacterized protein n=1 Tax=Palpitomonas bilix TaxID=652834 RepID=A0A7S3G8Z0_9EUKA
MGHLPSSFAFSQTEYSGGSSFTTVAAGSPHSSGGIGVVGAGAVSIFNYYSPSYAEEQEVLEGDSGDADEFGYSVSMNANGTILVVGAPSLSLPGVTHAGMVHVYTRYSGYFSRIQSFTSSYSSASDVGLGACVKVNGRGDILAVSTRTKGSGGGQDGVVEIYYRDTFADCPFRYLDKLASGQRAEYTPAQDDRFGASLAFDYDGRVIAVGTPGSSSNTGAVLVFMYKDKSFAPVQLIEPANVTVGAQFGSAIAFNSEGTVMAVGAPDATISSASEGVVMVYVWDRSAVQYYFQQMVVPNDPTRVGGRFGSSLSLTSSGSMLVVGSPEHEDYMYGEKAGAVFVFSL